MPKRSRVSRTPRKVGHVSGHVIWRARERFLQNWTNAHHLHLGRLIQEGKLVLLFRESRTRTHWLIQLGGKWGSAVYNSVSGAVCTLLDEAQTRQNLELHGLPELDYYTNQYRLDPAEFEVQAPPAIQEVPESEIFEPKPLTDYEKSFLPKWAAV